jgi:Domain of unknown function (DUF4258)
MLDLVCLEIAVLKETTVPQPVYIAKEDPPITQPDVEEALSNGKVILEENNKKDIIWQVKGRDLDLRSIVVVITLFEQEKRIKVITVWQS